MPGWLKSVLIVFVLFILYNFCGAARIWNGTIKLKMMRIVSPIFVAIFLFASSSADAKWPSPESKAQWTTACSDSLRQQKHSNPSGMCSCMADAFEFDYTAEEMARSLALNPDPNGNSLEKRLYITFIDCSLANP